MSINSLAGEYKNGLYIVSSIRKGKLEYKPWANEDFVYIPMIDSSTVGPFYFEIDKKLFMSTCKEES